MEGSPSPHQLFVHGYLTLQMSGLVALDFTEIDSSYGIDEVGLISEESHVNVPESSIIIPTRDYEHLCQQVNPLASSENYGIELYEDIAFSH